MEWHSQFRSANNVQMKSFSLKQGQDIVEPHCYIYESTYICNFMWFEELIALIFLIKVQIDISLLPVNVSLFFDQLFPLEKITMDRKVKEYDFHAFISASGWWNLNRSSHSRRTILFCNCQCTVWALLLFFLPFWSSLFFSFAHTSHLSL